MSVACASRFAVLKLEDDEPTTTKIAKDSMDTPETKTEIKTKGKKKKKKNSQDDANELQNMAFGGTKAPKTKNSQQRSKHNQHGNDKQWEEWKKKDAEFVSETYEQDLEQALLLSKIDFEEKKEFYDTVQKETEPNKSGNSNHRKKKRENSQKKERPVPMSLEDFQNLPSSGETSFNKKDANCVQDKNMIVPGETDFFDKLEEDVEKIINREQRQESYQRVQTYKDDQLRNIQYKDELEKKDQEIEKLKEEIRKSKLQSKVFKDRMKLMSKLLFEGEMQDKAKILVQVDKLTEVKDELTEQVTELHAALEQERSKVHALTTELKKYQSKKKENK